MAEECQCGPSVTEVSTVPCFVVDIARGVMLYDLGPHLPGSKEACRLFRSGPTEAEWALLSRFGCTDTDLAMLSLFATYLLH